METQKFIVTSKRNDYLYAYHTEYEVGDDNDREIAMKAIERCKPPLLDLRIEEVPNRPRRSMLVYTIELKYAELVDLCYTHNIKKIKFITICNGRKLFNTGCQRAY